MGVVVTGGVAIDNDSSAESFSFALPAKASQDQLSDVNADLNKDTPADVLFCNGRLLPQAYQCPSSQIDIGSDNSGLSSRTSSTNSKGSSSRSNSNSSNSGSSRYNVIARKTSIDNKPAAGQFEQHLSSSRPRKAAPPLASSTELSFREKSVDALVRRDCSLKKRNNQHSENSCFGKKVFQSFTSACRECHALEPSVKQGVIQKRMK
ncbi:hypothetical protein FRX31_007816 [Thalictrum thalictroides]|uniref:Membrane-associated kinase regulator n=1 Tax=Thalictrum thalictroides TaxID=46969 RepID=A0A7J6WYV2_THATH|nr:hypothetical protein FRX31_007816 [Thalictrum thalictroides]